NPKSAARNPKQIQSAKSQLPNQADVVAMQTSNIRQCSRIGTAVIIDHGPSSYQPGTIYMACGEGGYVGLVRLEDGRLNIAAAFDGPALRAAGHAAKLATQILCQAGLPLVPDIVQLTWKGTPRLTRHVRDLAAERLFI